MKTKKVLTCVLTYLLIFNGPVFAWNNIGHMAVAYVAYQHLNEATKTRVDKLLRLNPDYHKWLAAIPQGTSAANKKLMVFMMGAMWPDAIKSKSGYTDDGTEGGNRPDGATSVQNIGYTDRLHHKYWHFVDTPFSTDGSDLPALPT